MPIGNRTSGGEAQYLVRKKKRNFLQEVKEASGCMDCGEEDVVVLEFDHVNPEEKNIKLRASGTNSNSKGRSWLMLSWPELRVEVEKCEVVCANCHRRRTAKAQGWIGKEG